MTFREGGGKQQERLSIHPSEGEHRTSSGGLPLQYQYQQLNGLKKKDDLNPFKFSPDVDFCALSQLDKREKAQVIILFLLNDCFCFLSFMKLCVSLNRNVNVCKILRFMTNCRKLNV